ncbi:hypothetical protein Glove_25g24 [Diversispora epigaea]|uniref:Uncharacterized protein n=1 Tax=Diversispora epigaea TaxID=1348612 RepID=A0A397JKR5_9GLOM|nr:hypothetical protein Glove_25g24 [Diversispora epigaea]
MQKTQYWEDCEIYDFSDSEGISIITSICGSKWMNGQEYLLVSYADASKELEWHPKSNLRNSEQLIQEFKSKSKIKPKGKNINHIQQHEETPKVIDEYSALSMVRLISDFDDVSIDTEVEEEVEEVEEGGEEEEEQEKYEIRPNKNKITKRKKFSPKSKIISKCNILPEDTSQEVIYGDDDDSIMNTDSDESLTATDKNKIKKPKLFKESNFVESTSTSFQSSKTSCVKKSLIKIPTKRKSPISMNRKSSIILKETNNNNFFINTTKNNDNYKIDNNNNNNNNNNKIDNNVIKVRPTNSFMALEYNSNNNKNKESLNSTTTINSMTTANLNIINSHLLETIEKVNKIKKQSSRTSSIEHKNVSNSSSSSSDTKSSSITKSFNTTTINATTTFDTNPSAPIISPIMISRHDNDNQESTSILKKSKESKELLQPSLQNSADDNVTYSSNNNNNNNNDNNHYHHHHRQSNNQLLIPFKTFLQQPNVKNLVKTKLIKQRNLNLYDASHDPRRQQNQNLSTTNQQSQQLSERNNNDNNDDDNNNNDDYEFLQTMKFAVMKSNSNNYNEVISSPININISSVVKNSNDGLRTLIDVPLTHNNNSSSQWTGNLFKGETPELIGNVIIKPLEGRCQNTTYLPMISKIDQLWMRNFIPQGYAESMIKNNNPVEYPMFTMNVMSVTKGFIKNKVPKNDSESNGSIGTIWINEKEKLCWLVFPNYHRTSIILRLYPNPTETFILVTKKLPENCNNDASDFLKIQKPIVDINRIGIEFTAALKMMIKKHSLTSTHTTTQINNNNNNNNNEICFRTFGHEKNFEVQKLIQCFINLGGIYDKNLERKDISYYMIHVEKLNQICFIPHQIELKHTSCKFYIFGWNLEGSNPIDFYEIWSQEGGGLVTTTPKVYLTNKIDKICGIKNWQRATNKVNLNITLHPNILKQNPDIKEIKYLQELYRKRKLNLFEKTDLINPKENVNVEVLYKTMVNMQSIHCKDYRHFILVIDESEKYERMKFNCVCGVEKLTFDIFETKYGTKSFKL